MKPSNLFILGKFPNFASTNIFEKKKQKLKFHFLQHKYEFLCILQIRILLYCGVKLKSAILGFFFEKKTKN